MCIFISQECRITLFAACRPSTLNVSINHPFLSCMWVILSFFYFGNSQTLLLVPGTSSVLQAILPVRETSTAFFKPKTFCLPSSSFVIYPVYFSPFLDLLPISLILWVTCLLLLSGSHFFLPPAPGCPILYFPKVLYSPIILPLVLLFHPSHPYCYLLFFSGASIFHGAKLIYDNGRDAIGGCAMLEAVYGCLQLILFVGNDRQTEKCHHV